MKYEKPMTMNSHTRDENAHNHLSKNSLLLLKKEFIKKTKQFEIFFYFSPHRYKNIIIFTF